MLNFIESGKNIGYVNPSSSVAILGGSVVVMGAVCGVAIQDIAPLAQGTLLLEGVVSLPLSAMNVALGDRLYWNAGSSTVTKTQTDVPLGAAMSAQTSGDPTVNVKLYEVGREFPIAASLALLSQTIGGTYSQSAVQAISTQVDAIVTALKAAGLMAP